MHGVMGRDRLIADADYRRDIDGLRAVAVLSVLAFHYGLSLPPSWRLTGGFTGVDVFFVISGFLITSILAKEIEQDRFSILGFYDRRVRRILPALLVVLSVTLIAGNLLLMPGDYVSLANSAAGAAFGTSNFYFLNHTGYFDRSADLLPLLHTWSLGVEEQFYVVWPILLAIVVRRGKRNDTTAIIIALTMIGFAAGAVYFADEPKTAFYFPVTRAWELSLGALLAFLPRLRGKGAEFATVAGLAMIITGFVIISEETFSSATALLPCVGAALVIWPRDTGARSARCLGLLAPFGLISYSLYLWHWPVWVLYRIYINNGEPRIREAIALALVSIALAALSFRYIERPFRRPHPDASKTVIAGLAAALMIFCGGMYVDSADGFPQRIPPEIEELRSLEVMWEWPCPAFKFVPQLNNTYCTFGQPWATAKSKALLWGDSHAEHSAPLVQTAIPDYGTLLFASCPATFNQHIYRNYAGLPNYREQCADQRQRAINLLHDDPSINLVILASAWAYLPSITEQDGTLGNKTGIELDTAGLEDLILQASSPGRRFVIFGMMPQFLRDPIPCATLGLTGLLRRQCAPDQVEQKQLQTFSIPTDNMLRDIAHRHPNVTVVIPRDALCGAAGCTTWLNNEFLYRDGGHIRRNLSPKVLQDLVALLGLPAALNTQARSVARD
ncbi:acyltransferase family protein [Bradyrhizobium australafricanum]|uniref:acyltransferase family protein n=1 Tax=Bradyrhizobium australafricanum TaxID=2821406 RepID=UPI001CE2510A|nr:acyltransferase family protein [Bradyrhizobium australafricanum]